MREFNAKTNEKEKKILPPTLKEKKKDLDNRANFTVNNLPVKEHLLKKKVSPPAWPWPASSAGTLSAPLLLGSSSRHPHRPFSYSLFSPYPPGP